MNNRNNVGGIVEIEIDLISEDDIGSIQEPDAGGNRESKKD